MSSPRVCVVRAPGTNCDAETAYAFEISGAIAERMHLFRLLEEPRILRDFQVLCLPGGFSFGDDVGAGVILASRLRGHLGTAVGEFLCGDNLVLGICNGFQALLKSGILPSGTDEWPPERGTPKPATLTWNDNGKYTALWVRLACRDTGSIFLRGIDELELPVAHAEGRLVSRDRAVLDDWLKNRQIALCYAAGDVNGERVEEQREPLQQTLPYPENPNGSINNIAGLSDPSGRVLGLMPHPERFIHPTQHPQWTRRGVTGEADGLKLFRNAVAYFN